MKTAVSVRNTKCLSSPTSLFHSSDDLLNYELGEDLLDDQDDLAGDEDALLLSDEGL